MTVHAVAGPDLPVIGTDAVRRLALARSGLLAPGLTDLPDRAAGRGRRARERCLQVVERFGYLQLDTVAVSGARTHGIVLAARLTNLDAGLTEALLAPGEPLFEYWGHEACWLPMVLYPALRFRRREFRVHPWYGDVLGDHAGLARDVLARIGAEGPLRSADFEGASGSGWEPAKLARKVLDALWLAGDIAVRERRGFQRIFDLTERVIPASVAARRMGDDESLDALLERALAGHGFATTGTLAATWRLRNRAAALRASLHRLVERGVVHRCVLDTGTRRIAGWVRPSDLDLVDRLAALRPRRDRGVLLSPFDPVLWDRGRTRTLFGFDQVLEIYKPAAERRFGYYCLPVLAGDRLIARVDLKASRERGRLEVLSRHFEQPERSGRPRARDRAAVDHALRRFANVVGLAAPDADPAPLSARAATPAQTL